jgi:diguanylate cyclase (GGDEF)-like protein
MAPNQQTLIWSWIATAFATSAVIVVVGPELAIPTGTIAGRVLTCAVMLGVLARCIWVAVFIHKLQRRVREKNKALQAALQRIEVMANRDELTGLPNRRAILNALVEQIALATRAGLPLSIALIDIDHFKLVNDHYGHLAGDRALQIFSELASTTIRVSDRLGRYGGEEFLLVMPATQLEETEVPLERIRQRIAKWDWSAIDERLRLTLTIGVTEYAKGDSSGELVRRADVALYLGKETGRNRIVLDRCQLPKVQATSANLRMASAEGLAK